MIGSF